MSRPEHEPRLAFQSAPRTAPVEAHLVPLVTLLDGR
jgi:hypothetical protein